MTKLETAIAQFAPDFFDIPTSRIAEKQEVLDRATPQVINSLQPPDLVAHSQESYDAGAEDYARNPQKRDVIDELIMFMNMLPDGARVLDIGCGYGRDALFMAVANIVYRYDLMGREKDGMKTRDKFMVPARTFRVIGLDQSTRMLARAWQARDFLVQRDLLTIEKSPDFNLGDMHHFAHLDGHFDAIWACTSLFTHTPLPFLGLAMESVARALRTGGLFFTSYTAGAVGKRYDKLLVKPGGVEYFSQPPPRLIEHFAQKCGMALKAQIFSDFEIGGKVIKENLFVSQFFRKTKQAD